MPYQTNFSINMLRYAVWFSLLTENTSRAAFAITFVFYKITLLINAVVKIYSISRII